MWGQLETEQLESQNSNRWDPNQSQRLKCWGLKRQSALLKLFKNSYGVGRLLRFLLGSSAVQGMTRNPCLVTQRDVGFFVTTNISLSIVSPSFCNATRTFNHEPTFHKVTRTMFALRALLVCEAFSICLQSVRCRSTMARVPPNNEYQYCDRTLWNHNMANVLSNTRSQWWFVVMTLFWAMLSETKSCPTPFVISLSLKEPDFGSRKSAILTSQKSNSQKQRFSFSFLKNVVCAEVENIWKKCGKSHFGNIFSMFCPYIFYIFSTYFPRLRKTWATDQQLCFSMFFPYFFHLYKIARNDNKKGTQTHHIYQ